ncbi:MAG: DUF2278 family protein [Gammaproteobacteria bacterium]
MQTTTTTRSSCIGGPEVYRIASNVKSSAPNAPSVVLFQSTTALPDDFIKGLRKLSLGFTALLPKPGTLAIDYVRGGLVKTKSMKPVPPDQPGADNDLKDLRATGYCQCAGRRSQLVGTPQ